MGLNVDNLRDGLLNYNQSLSRHLQKLQEDFNSLMAIYQRLHQEYEGQAAEEFKNSWEQTSRWFEEYITDAKKLSKTLVERIDSIKPV